MDHDLEYEMHLECILIKYGIDYSVRSTTITDSVIYDIPDNVWNNQTFQHDYLKLQLKK